MDKSWTLLGRHRMIAVREESTMTGENGIVRTQGGRLNVRRRPDGEVIGQLENGCEVQILDQEGDWLRIVWGEEGGYAAAAYISREATGERRLRIVDEAGNVFEPVGGFTAEWIGND